MSNFFYTSLRPAMYHGHGKKPPYFEGWYYKLVSADETYRYAVIPGVLLGEQGHAFIQVLDGATGQSSYHSFPLEDFWASEENFQVRISANQFTREYVQLDVESAEGEIKGVLQFDDPNPWPVSWTSPGIMGWYAWVPFMETYHGVLSFDHYIEGNLEINGQVVDFHGGRGYIEKDWGQAFPEAYIWFQTNHFETLGTSVTASVAIIPWLRSNFRGFIAGLWHDQILYRFATYTNATIEKLAVSDTRVDWIIADKNYILELKAARAQDGLLRGPSRMDMGRRVNESFQAVVEVRLLTTEGKVVFEGQGRNAGLEVHGDLERLLSFT